MVQIEVDEQAPSASYCLPNYLQTNIYSMSILKNKIVFIASTGIRDGWIDPRQNEQQSALIFVHFESEWITISFDQLLREQSVDVSNVRIINIQSIELREYSLLCTVWSSISIETMEWTYYLSTFCWKNEDKMSNICALLSSKNMTTDPVDFIPFCMHSAPFSYVFVQNVCIE